MAFEPVNPRASPEARKLLKTLQELSGKSTLSGQHNYPGTGSSFYDHAFEITDRHPALWGADFGFSADGKDSILCRAANMQDAIRRHREGSIITLMWHAVRPMDEEPNGWKQSVQNKLTDTEWEQLITPGTALHRRWLAQLDPVAGHLQRLCSESVPVLWRPFHECNGGWFWWGGRPGPKGTQALYRLMFEVFTKKYCLNNLLWVWNANKTGTGANAADPYRDYYPGHAFVDILATDIYGGDYQERHYEELLAVAQGRPVALGEVGKVPTPAVLDRQPLWVWFMMWCDYLEKDNTHEEIRALYRCQRVLSRVKKGVRGSMNSPSA